MYMPTVARFTARDPLPENGNPVVFLAMTPYAYAAGNPVNVTDASGLDVDDGAKGTAADKDAAAALAACKAWSDKAQKDLAWLKDLPDCPCYLCEIQYDPNNWTPPEDASPVFHPGAEKCIRSVAVLGKPRGQQCCYKGYELITSGPGAGTPDYFNPGTNPLPHYLFDVLPYDNCKKAGRLDLYYLGRPPNDGGTNNCEPQEV